MYELTLCCGFNIAYIAVELLWIIIHAEWCMVMVANGVI